MIFFSFLDSLYNVILFIRLRCVNCTTLFFLFHRSFVYRIVYNFTLWSYWIEFLSFALSVCVMSVFMFCCSFTRAVVSFGTTSFVLFVQKFNQLSWASFARVMLPPLLLLLLLKHFCWGIGWVFRFWQFRNARKLRTCHYREISFVLSILWGAQSQKNIIHKTYNIIHYFWS